MAAQPSSELHHSVHLDQWRFWEMAFRLKCYECIEQAYQDLFVRVMKLRHGTDFEPVAAWGSIGDLKCDGYRRSTRSIFQVYAPERMVQDRCVRKVRQDHAGAVTHWRPRMGQWIFVHNLTEGLPPKVLALLGQLRSRHKWHAIDTWDRFELLDQVRQLPAVLLTELLGPAPGPTPTTLLQDDIRITVRRLAALIDAEEATPLEEVREVPKKKLEFNTLGVATKSLLKTGARFSERVRMWFDHDPDPTTGTKIAKGFKRRYKALRKAGCPPDDIFALLLLFAGDAPSNPANERIAALAVLAYLFETCHIFEAPKSRA